MGGSLGPTRHILLVDDEVDFLFSASVALRKAGFRVSVAENGREALFNLLDSQKGTDPFDLLVVDIRMPGMTGVELINTVQRCGICTPFCAITGFHDRNLASDLERSGCLDVIEKPFEPEELVRRVKAILEFEGTTPAN